MNKVNRRGFFQSLTRASQSADAGNRVTVIEGNLSAAPDVSRRAAEALDAPPSAAASGFSLKDFYAARGPQVLPPIVIRPSVLQYCSELTHVGCPPAHDAPDFSDDPTYNQLSACGVSDRDALDDSESPLRGSK